MSSDKTFSQPRLERIFENVQGFIEKYSVMLCIRMTNDRIQHVLTKSNHELHLYPDDGYVELRVAEQNKLRVIALPFGMIVHVHYVVFYENAPSQEEIDTTREQAVRSRVMDLDAFEKLTRKERDVFLSTIKYFAAQSRKVQEIAECVRSSPYYDVPIREWPVYFFLEHITYDDLLEHFAGVGKVTAETYRKLFQGYAFELKKKQSTFFKEE